MKMSVCLRMCVAVLGLWAVAGLCAAQQRPIRIDVKCEDPSIQLQLNQHVVSEVAQSQNFRLVSDNSAKVQVQILAAPVRVQGGNAPLLGVALATIIRKKDGQKMKMVSFTNRFVPLEDIESEMRNVVRQSIAQE